ncbi:outer-membrane lipoprotein carrier protein LolA [Caulobacter sp.]|uniref:outer-membrane lipoprotein carrier protein LolA n=1 Tax=Caulobacter sp. TaxID=78 RepID=UPI001B03ADCF|nr:outer-membrane lipoprotein carrier protein LolA [Caulobacter sp.]MBO9546047.1 outer-membrane lipoprotein carrier protein LolA [Caulobacter sp.]
MTNRRFLLAAGLAAAIASPAFAQQAAPAPAKLNAEQQALLDKATAYIQGLSSAKGRFVQTDARGTQTTGTLYLQRPGKARFAYDPPAGLLVVSNGNNVNIFDSRLKTFQSYPLSKTPLNLLLAREVRLDRGVTITDIRPLADGFTIVAQDARRQALGRISIDFSNSPIGLMGWTITDLKGGTTRVRLSEFSETSGLDPALFVLTDPRRKVGKP